MSDSRPPLQLGAIPLSALYRRASPSAEAALARQIERELALTPLERIREALRLGALNLGSGDSRPGARGEHSDSSEIASDPSSR